MTPTNDPLDALFGAALERLPAFMRTGPLANIDSLCRHYVGPLEVAQGTAEDGVQVPVADVHATALLKLGLTTTDAQYVYWVNAGSGVMNGEFVRALRGDLTTAEVLLPGLDSPVAVAASDDAIYFAEKPAVFKLLHGATVPETVATGFSEVKNIAVYGATLYGVGMEGLWKVAVSGSDFQELEHRPMSGLALACNGVYATGWYESVLVRYGP